MSWEYSLDQILWSGGRTQDDGNQTEYEPQNVKDYIFQYITETGGDKPYINDIMNDLDIADEFYEDVESTLSIYEHEEEVEFRESV